MDKVFFSIERMGNTREETSILISVVSTTPFTEETNLQKEKLVTPPALGKCLTSGDYLVEQWET